MNIEVIVLLLAFFVGFQDGMSSETLRLWKLFFFSPLVDLKQIFLSEGVVQSEL